MKTAASSYADIPAIDAYVVPKKQAAKRHYGSHQYFTKRAWNVVQAYIERFTKPGDVVCDPYGGSGVTAIEALVLGRRPVYLDISRWATFLATQVAIAPVDLSLLSTAYETVEGACASRIQHWWEMTEEEVNSEPLSNWYPQNYPLPKNADVRFVENLFTRRQLLALSELYHHIQQVRDPICRDLLRYAFSATLYMCNRTFISAKGRKESRGGSSIFSIFRYKIAKEVIELNPWKIFTLRLKRLMVCKKETNDLIGKLPDGSANGRFLTGYAQQLTRYVKPESVDYIFTDPPYGAHISYLDLTRMWDAWLGFETSNQDREEETIENGDAKHTPEHFKEKLSTGINEMFKVLKYDRWLSIVFAHREPAMWDTIVKASEAAGFEYVNTVAQPLNVIWSMHKKKNPLTVLSGELILNFRKVRNPRTLFISTVGSDALGIIKDSAELSIVSRRGATTDEIYSDLIPKLLENGLLGEVASKIGDITPVLQEEFNYDEGTRSWDVKAGRKLGSHIPLEQRIQFYVTDYLNQRARTGEHATVDEIVYNVLPKLKNGTQPRKQKIVDEIRKIAVPYRKKYWVLREEPQQSFDFEQSGANGDDGFKVSEPRADEYSHNEVLVLLAKLGRAAGFSCYIGRKEQTAIWEGNPLSELSVNGLQILRGSQTFTKNKVEQIDLIWLDSNQPAFAFEVEHSTSISTALDRFIELLKVAKASERLIVVAPQSRQRKLNQVLSESHYIGAPMYMEMKVRYLWYSDVFRIASRFVKQQPTKALVVEAIGDALHIPQPKR